MTDTIQLTDPGKVIIRSELQKYLERPILETQIDIEDDYAAKESGDIVYFVDLECDLNEAAILENEFIKQDYTNVVFSISGYPIIKMNGVISIGDFKFIVLTLILKDKYLYYHFYLKSNKWRTFRNSVLKNRGYNCEQCSSKKDLHIHHITYENLGHEDENDVIILCGKCHAEAHQKRSLKTI